MGNVLSKEKREQVIALGRLGWSLRRIEQATGVRRETAGDYLRSAGIALRTPSGWGRKPPAKAATSVITGSDGSKPANEVTTGFSGLTPADNSKPANEVITGFLPAVTLPVQEDTQAGRVVGPGLSLGCGQSAGRAGRMLHHQPAGRVAVVDALPGHDQYHRKSSRWSAHPEPPRHPLAKRQDGDSLAGFGLHQNGKEVQQDHGLSRFVDLGSNPQRQTACHRAGCCV